MENIIISLIAAIGCFSAMMINAPEYLVIKAIQDSNDGKITYPYIKMALRGYNLLFLILLNLFCFITQFFYISNDLKFVLFSINVIFFVNALWDIVVNSYNKNYISLLQSKLVNPVKLIYMFDVEENCVMPSDCNYKGIYVIIKNRIYYQDDNKKICLYPKKFGYKKTPIKYGEMRFIVSQLNENGESFNEDIEIKTFYKHRDLYEYSDYFVFGEIKNNKFRKLIFKCIPFMNNILNTILCFVYAALGVIAVASACGSNWFDWFNL